MSPWSRRTYFGVGHGVVGSPRSSWASSKRSPGLASSTYAARSRDRYAAGWVRQSFRAEGITYVESKLTKAEAYLEALALFSQGRIEIMDHPQLIRELQCLERRTRASGKDVVDHSRGGHDDYANVTALAADAARKRQPRAGIATA